MLKQVREQFLKFFESKNHLITKSASIIPQNDDTLLFINAGMAPMKRFFLQKDTPPSQRVVNSQNCLRVGGKHNDLADVGYTKRHHTFFEMLGNFSFGDYFQKEAMQYAWEFLTQVMKIDSNRLYITVHPNDATAYKLACDLTSEDKIIKLEENVWKMGDVGPFGYCCEIFYDLQVGTGDFIEGDRYLEVWNLVFMSKQTDGITIEDLPAKCIDAGMGLERLVSVLENVDSNYETSFFKSALPFLNLQKHTTDSRIFLDHIRALAFIITQGVHPGAGNREYVVRRIARRALKSFFEFENLNLKETIAGVLNNWQKEYVTQWNIPKIVEIMEKEKESFQEVLEAGMKLFEEFFEQKHHLTAQQLFLLHDTHGFSIDIAMDLVKKRNGTADCDGFEEIMNEFKEKNREIRKNIVLPFPATQFVDSYELEATVLGEYEGCIILDKTPFYAEGGGQIGDIGSIGSAKIIDTKKIGNVYIHKYEGTAPQGQVIAKIDIDRRLQIRAHHSATHMLQYVLQETLGEHVKQMGSLVAPDRLRLDFTHEQQVSDEEIVTIERKMNEYIQSNAKTQIKHMQYNDAITAGAMALFAYDDEVRTIKIGNSFELCGGTHVEATGEIGLLKIVKISSVSAGVKRIEAVVAQAAFELIQKQQQVLNSLSQALKVPAQELEKKIQQLLKKKVDVKIDIHIQKEEINGVCIGFAISEVEIDLEKEMKKENLTILCSCITSAEKVNLKIKVAHAGYDAKEIAMQLGAVIGAKGCGGRKDFAQTGGKIDDVQKIWKKLKELL